ncbi:Cellulose-growth-specific protein [Hypsizygus marmoreus]|uniref:lytic cellulose monooxygenase (C4-dehydrogenating) n=1 Tax=Hypsizygus marmoreus TaxID=39966 RepID=A0A369K8X1_HYPMA|nr:Cellulose-growth-specific protein [Hypsizygus marmoreus]
MKSISLFVPLLAAAYVSAHGFVSTITIDGKTFKGNRPSGSKSPSIIRQISTQDPVKGANNAAVNCGPNAQVASLVADAKPGSTITFDWTAADLSNWPHNTGPMLTYMASCGSTSCDKFDSQNAKWFKIQQVGKVNGDWAQAKLKAGDAASVTIPSTLASGNYLIRHEIIALHLGTQKGGAEFYPSCAQLRITGNEKGAPTANELVSLPGAYSDNDPGIFDRSVYDRGATYVFPGPKIAAFVSGAAGSGSGSGSNSNTGNASPSNDSPATPSATSSKPKPTGSCTLKKKISASVNAKVAARTIRPRHISRVMRGLIAGHSQ